MKEFILTEQESERTVLVGLVTPQQNEAKVNEYLDELAFLADTAGAVPVKNFIQKLDYPNPVTFVGKGKLEEIRQYVEENEIGLVIFDDELSPKQLKNIEEALKVKILDRTSLILDIFAKRAQTAHAKTQVELAQYQYLLPRLTRLWTHLERQRGG
ncbi:MAG: GTPase HflX, partial [Bacteroidales bacterium]|nr:GTPase HflX [Bacteroidales bacterium]